MKGLELPGYEPRALQAMALGLAVGARGADHNRSGAYEVDLSAASDRLTADAGKAVKEAQSELDAKVLAGYAKLSEAEIKSLVVENKWFAALQAGIEGEVEQLTQRLAARVRELEERYAKPLPTLSRDIELLSAKVEGHLKVMGFAWA